MNDILTYFLEKNLTDVVIPQPWNSGSTRGCVFYIYRAINL